MARMLFLGSCSAVLMACAPAPALHAPAASNRGLELGFPDEQGMDARELIALTEWVRDWDVPIFSLLISRNNVLVYELYTSSLTREDAHYSMSVTKSVTSALVGVAIDRKLIAGQEASVADTLPRELFASDGDRERFRGVSLHQVLGMSALDAELPPHRYLPQDVARGRDFWVAPNRTAFALRQPLLGHPGASFQYNDITPLIAGGAVQYSSGKSLLAFAEETLFGPMDFRNYEWMHQDAAGIDNAAYGLRLRPFDMQKLGVLFLNGGRWKGKQLLSSEWVEAAFSPWIRSRPDLTSPNYGCYWWSVKLGRHFTAHVADGWKGQRIAVIPEQNMVVTMTGVIERGDEEELFQRLFTKYIIPASSGTPDPSLRSSLAEALKGVQRGPLRGGPNIESRMIPSVEPKESHRPFAPE